MARLGMRRLTAWGLVSTTLAAATILSAFRKRSDFYSAAVYLSKSNACMMILWNQALFHTVVFGKVLQAIFFGELRLIEVERLQERAWFAVTETLLALTIFREDFDSSFVVLFVSLLFLKVFHWLAADRVEAMEQAARVSRLAHARMVGLLSLLLFADMGFIYNAVDTIMIDGPTVMIMFASEYLILIATALAIAAKYVINCIDMQREAPWEEKSIWVFYVELTADFFKLVTYLVFFGLILTFYGLPLNILRDVYITLRSFVLKVRDLRRYRQATRNMDELYPNATRQEMEAMTDRTCIICREDMEYRPAPGAADQAEEGAAPEAADVGAPGQGELAPEQPVQAGAGPNDTPKKLPCSHVFHFHCLRSWLERQQSCPTCRRSVLPQEQPPVPAPRAGAPPPADAAGPAHNAEDAAIRQAQVNIARNLGREAFGALFPEVPFPLEAEDPAAQMPPLPPPLTGPAHPRDPSASAAAPRPAAPGLAPLPGDGVPLSTSASADTAVPSSSSLAPIDSTPGASTVSPAAPDNPLARFALPSLPVPPTGEAGLYHQPPTFAYPPYSSTVHSGEVYADIAYGAYPHFAGMPAHPPAPAAAGMTGARAAMNVEERVGVLRRQWGGSVNTTAGNSRQASASAGLEREDQEPTAAETKKLDKGKGKQVEPDPTSEVAGEDDPAPNPRDAALRAAELRAGVTDLAAFAPGTASALPAAEAATTSGPIPAPRPASPTPPADSSRGASSPPGSQPLPMPRLIPLFDPLDPSLSSPLYPTTLPDLLSNARPLLPPLDQLNEVEQLARRGVEDRLRLLIGFQERIERLVGEMKEALEGAPLAAAPKGTEAVSTNPTEPGQEPSPAERNQ